MKIISPSNKGCEVGGCPCWGRPSAEGETVVSPILSTPAPLEGGRAGAGGASEGLNHDSVPSKCHVEMVGMGTECELKTAWTVRGICPECGYRVDLQRNTCGQVQCPRCFRTWARRAAERSAARVYGFFFAHGSHHKPRHITIEGSGLDWEAYKRRLLALGFTGGVLILHPYRIKDEYRAMFEIMAEKTGQNRYDVVRQSALGLDALEYSPHCHFIGFGKGKKISPGSSTFEYRVLRKLPSLGSVERSMFYLLGHSLRPDDGKKAVKYFGVCAYNRLAPSWQGTCRADLLCDQCGAKMINMDSLKAGVRELVVIKKYIALGWHIMSHGHSGIHPGTGKPGTGGRAGDAIPGNEGRCKPIQGTEGSENIRAKPFKCTTARKSQQCPLGC